MKFTLTDKEFKYLRKYVREGLDCCEENLRGSKVDTAMRKFDSWPLVSILAKLDPFEHDRLRDYVIRDIQDYTK